MGDGRHGLVGSLEQSITIWAFLVHHLTLISDSFKQHFCLMQFPVVSTHSSVVNMLGLMFAPDTQEEAAMAYDRAAVECRGVNAVTNFQLSSHLGDTNKSPSHPAVPHGGEKSSEADSQGPAYDPNHEPAVSGTSLQKLREEDLSMSSQVLNSIDWLSPSVVLRIPMYRSRVLLPPSCELEGMITKACEALEGRVIMGTTRNLSKVTV
jgi:hypothetical protein